MADVPIWIKFLGARPTFGKQIVRGFESQKVEYNSQGEFGTIC